MAGFRTHRSFHLGLLLVVLSVAGPARSGALAQEAAAVPQTVTGFVDRVFRDDAGEHKYVVFVPKDYNPERKWPVILFLHGAGERGTDGRAQLNIGLGPIVKQRSETFPFVVVFPQCEDTRGRILDAWSAESPDGRRALAILDEVQQDYSIDKNHQILTGWSMGGYGVWSLAAAQPKRFAAVVPLSGGGDPATAGKLASAPIWAFHGAQDTVVRAEESRRMVEAVREAGGNVRYDELPDGDHNIWNTVYGNDALYAWMNNPNAASVPSTAPLSARPGTRTAAQAEANQPFVPALEVQNAVYIRLGNDVLKALSYSIPESIPPSALTGAIPNIHDSTSVDGRSFSITFAGVGYAAQLERAHVEAYAPGRLNVQLGLRNVHLRIGGAYVSGRRHSATTGPISIVIGQSRPAWLSFDVMPYVQGRQIKLQLLATRFQIDNDNWSVSAPAGVSTHGLGMTEEKVSSGLVSGLYGAKYRIEREVQAVVPSLLAQVEQRLQVTEASDVVQSFWPLPVYKPRVRVWPAEVSTDEQGVSIMLGVTAAAIDPRQAPAQPRQVATAARSAASVPRVTDLRVGVAPGLLGPLTKLLIDADVARIHVLDIPEKQFAPLADPVALAQAIPDLKRYGNDVEIWSEIILAEPLGVRSVGQEAGRAGQHPAAGNTSPSLDGQNSVAQEVTGAGENAAVSPPPEGEFQFYLPKLLLSLAFRTPGEQNWTPLAEVEMQIGQAASATVEKPDLHTRALKLDWEGAPQIEATGRFAPGYQAEDNALDAQRLAEMFAAGWAAWTASTASSTVVDDVTFGRQSVMRLSDAGWNPPHLFVDFTYPTIRLTNSASQPFVYETKGPYSGWGGPYRLEPGQTHSYSLPHPLIYRQRSERGFSMFTLPVGSHSEYRVPARGGAPSLFQARESIIAAELGEPEGKLSGNEPVERRAATASAEQE